MSLTKKLEFKCLCFQVQVDGQLVQVLDDRTAANSYAEKFYKGYAVVIIPIPVFTYT